MNLIINVVLITFLNLLLLTKGTHDAVINGLPIEEMQDRFQRLVPLLTQKRSTRSTKVIHISPRNTGSSSMGCNTCQQAAAPACPVVAPACPFAAAPAVAPALPPADYAAAAAPTIIMLAPPPPAAASGMPIIIPTPPMYYTPYQPSLPTLPTPSAPSGGGIDLPSLSGDLPSLGGNLPSLGDLSGSLPGLDLGSLLSRSMAASSSSKPQLVRAKVVRPNVVYMPPARASTYTYSSPANIMYLSVPSYSGGRMAG